MKREPFTSTDAAAGAWCKAATKAAVFSKWRAAPAWVLKGPAVQTVSMQRAWACAPTSAWNCGPWLPTSPMSPSTNQRGAGRLASTSMAASTESGLAL